MDRDEETYRILVYGRCRPSDIWQGWLVFERVSDGRRFDTEVETTQPTAEAVLYWGSGLTDVYLDGALERAKRKHRDAVAGVVLPARPELGSLERAVLTCFKLHHQTRLLTNVVFDEIGRSHVQVLRALEELEQQEGLLVRRTEEGNDYLFLTARGAKAAGLQRLVSRLDENFRLES